ncbi:methyl-accepting chemotaxis protein [Variovorax ginsengisoli]|uniref:Methyl-accepting chemotaxis protein n=1 Tax=Variovorax ginsengisoli TaxID=363844 RepID=A0ABT9SCU4_9BURK|nr:methyl-accepting chemotaxis protein [Variovorax ginsengisoli]
MLALAAVMAVLGIVGMQRLNQSADLITDRALVKERLAALWLKDTGKNSVRTFSLVASNDADVQALLQKEMSSTSNAISETQKRLEAMLDTPEEKALSADIQAKRTAYIALRTSILKLKEANQLVEAKALTSGKLVPALATYEASVSAMLEHQKSVIDQSAKDINSLYQSACWTLIALASVALAIGAAVAWWLTQGITQPLREALAFAQTVASGDLRSAVTAQASDETGQLLEALGKMQESLAAVVSVVRNGTHTIATASREIAAGNQDLSSRTEEQASSLEQTAASMEELTSTVKQNAENARQANQLSASASDIAVRGGSIVSQVVNTMTAIDGSSKKIVDIISVIDGIAFQTNILALNAAVEAARAGEQGRGFAVVASEVRNLAQRSAAAAKEIKGLIDTSVGNVNAGTALVDEAGRTMGQIVDSVQRVTDIMGEITAASQEQTTGIEQINQAITQMDQVTQQNAALVEEAAAAASSLQEQAHSLVQTVSVFKLAEQAYADAPAPNETAVPMRVAHVTRAQSRNLKLVAAAAPEAAAPHKPASRPMTSPALPSDEWATF